MLINLSVLLTILYEWSLFILLALLIKRLTVQYILPVIYAQIKQAKEHLKHLKEQKSLLADTRERIEESMQVQTKELASLEEKIKLWHAAQIATVKQTEEEHKRKAKALLAKKELQRLGFHQAKIARDVIPEAISLAHAELAQKYGGEKGALVLTELIDEISRLATLAK